MLRERPEQALGSYSAFLQTPLSALLREHAERDPWPSLRRRRGPRASAPSPAVRVRQAVRAILLRLNSEFAHDVPPDRQLPRISLWPPGHPEYFPVGVKHRYARK